MIQVYGKLLDLLDGRERRHLIGLAVLMLCIGVADLIGVSAILVLLNAMAAPEALLDTPAIARIYAWGGFTEMADFQTFVSVLVVIAFFISLMVRASGTYAVIRFAMRCGYSISTRLLRRYLGRPYQWFLRNSSSEVHKRVLSEVDQVVGQVITPGLQMLTNGVSMVFIISFLLAVDPAISVLAGAILGGGYGAIYARFRGRLQQLGRQRMAANGARYQLVAEATGGFKEVKLMGLEESYARRFDVPARQQAQANTMTQLIVSLPRFALEALAFLCLVVLIVFLTIRSDGDLVSSLPTLGAFGFAAMRLIPVLQQIFFGLSALRTGSVVLNQLHADFTAITAPDPEPSATAAAPQPVRLKEALVAEGIHFTYEGVDTAVLNGVSLTIPARTSIGLVGGTGAGKTTLVDLILGLIEPSQGRVTIDGTPLTPANRRAWQRRIGYVPQAIFLMDDTIARNIAFGAAPDDIDMAAVERSARMAALHDFVTTELPDGYDTLVGERGVRLSGGQRQRIGIARALYEDPDLLVMDEATSALDTLTERAVMDAVHNVQGEKTIILIAHRLTTVKACDRIFMLERGQIVADGSYDSLVADNEVFRKMATGS